MCKIYEHIEAAENYSRERNYKDTIREYKASLEKLTDLEKGTEFNKELKNALGLLREDICIKIRELKICGQKAKTDGSGVPKQGGSGSNNGIGYSIGSGDSDGECKFLDSFLVSIIHKLQHDILEYMSEKFVSVKGFDRSEAEKVVSVLFGKLQRDISIVEQGKFREYDANMKQLVKENKKLCSQVLRLRDRWDSLIESARQKRNQKENNSAN